MNWMKVLRVALSLLCLRLTAPVSAFGGSYDQNEVCKGQDSIVLRSDADVGANAEGLFVYAASLVFCCEGQAYDIFCTEGLLGYCNCPIPEDLQDELDAVLNGTKPLDQLNVSLSAYERSIACYARQCAGSVTSSPIASLANRTFVSRSATGYCYTEYNQSVQLRQHADEALAAAEEEERAAAARLVERVLQLELGFWDMATEGHNS